MVKKGKYRLFNYFIENHLIYYKSLGKNSKIIAFAILKFLNLKSIESILNDFLRNRIIQYYAIQININEKSESLLILNFEESKKERIIKSANFIRQKIIETQNNLKFLKEENLELTFFSNLSQDINSNTIISKTSQSLIISTENNSTGFNFFHINLDFIKQKNSFLLNFSSILKNLGINGFLVFNFKIDNNENIKISSYFVEKCKNIENPSNIEKKLNDFFHCSLVIKQDIKMRTIFNYIWRLEITDRSYFLNDFLDLFFSKSNPFSLEILEINKRFEQELLKYQIAFIRLSDNLIFIENSYLFIILENLNSKYIQKILEKYYPKYIIYILILNDSGYKKLREYKSIENIRIIHPNNMKNFNYQEFKRVNSLKDAQINGNILS
jgi:hypothetical protein